MTNEAILEALKVQPLTEEEKQKRHILKRLTGPIASCKEGTRNGRKYNKDLWMQALNDEVFKEKIANKGLLLELGHPADREEIDMSCACACIPEAPKIIDDELYAVVDVLDTPAGNILNTLIDYGFRPGISSRGTGDVIGDEVDPETFCLETWDIVNVPALKKARLTVTESLEKENSKLKKVLSEALESATDKDRKIMSEALTNLGMSNVIKDDIVDIDSEQVKEEESAVDNGNSELIESLQKTLKENLDLKKQLSALQEKLAVSDTKVNELNEELINYKDVAIKLSDKAKLNSKLQKQIDSLQESLNSKDTLVESKEAEIKKQAELITALQDKSAKNKKTLTESISKSNDEIKMLKEHISTFKNKVDSLNEKLEDSYSQLDSKQNLFNKELGKYKRLAEYYKKQSIQVMNDYINSKAVMLGITSNEIKNRLDESYTTEDVDRVCESIQNISMNLNKLPFGISKNARVRIKEKLDTNLLDTDDSNIVDDDLLSLANLK